ncbi:hypothetical protein NDU88_008459, partial [Pleurodeles waltl]
DPEECASYRPISLLNIDAKLFTGILAHRLNPYMPGLVDPDQSGFIPHRQCGDNTKRLLHLLDKTDRSRREALFLYRCGEGFRQGSLALSFPGPGAFQTG